MREKRTGKSERREAVEAAPTEEQWAPLLGRWRNWYYFTAASLVFYIIALSLFSRWFS